MEGEELVFKIKADFLRALAHPTRLAVIEHLKVGERSVGQLVRKLGSEQSSLSKHLAVLRQAGILKSRQVKVSVYYSIRNKSIFQVLRPIAMILRETLKDGQKVLTHLGKA